MVSLLLTSSEFLKLPKNKVYCRIVHMDQFLKCKTYIVD